MPPELQQCQKEFDWNILKDTEKNFSFFKESALSLIYMVDYLGQH